jgi:hypothetical protein
VPSRSWCDVACLPPLDAPATKAVPGLFESVGFPAGSE